MNGKLTGLTAQITQTFDEILTKQWKIEAANLAIELFQNPRNSERFES